MFCKAEEEHVTETLRWAVTCSSKSFASPRHHHRLWVLPLRKKIQLSDSRNSAVSFSMNGFFSVHISFVSIYWFIWSFHRVCKSCFYLGNTNMFLGLSRETEQAHGAHLPGHWCPLSAQRGHRDPKWSWRKECTWTYQEGQTFLKWSLENTKSKISICL